jgi:DivIVA domain-containing protein
MEISGRILREVEFRDRLRGYDTDEVDEFLEKVAVAVDELLAELQAAREKAGREIEPALDDESLRRTLVLAQRTADMAVREAREEAAALIEEARLDAGALTAEARDEAGRLRAEAEQDAHARLGALEERRGALEREIAELERFAATEKARLAAALESLSAVPEVGDGSPPAGGDEASAMPADVGSADEPTELIDEVVGEPDSDESVGSPVAPRQVTGERPRRQNHASQLGLAEADDDPDEVPDRVQTRRRPEPTLRAVDSSGDDPDEELWQRWARGADLDVVPDQGSQAPRPTANRASRRGGGRSA